MIESQTNKGGKEKKRIHIINMIVNSQLINAMN